jgi:O-antigen/teichoic acid export membrane protein
MGAAFGSQVLGWYAFALRIARTPLAMLGASVGQVFQQRAAQVWNDGGDLGALARRTMGRLALLALPFGLLMLWAPQLFAWAFGAEWREAGAQVRLLAPWILLNFLTSPLSQLPLIVGRQASALLFGIAYQAAMLLPYLLAWWLHWDITTALALQSGASSLVLAAYGVWLYRLAATRRAL